MARPRADAPTQRQVDLLAERSKELEGSAEHFLEANRVCLDILGALIPQFGNGAFESATVRARLGVIEDILTGANQRYEGGH